MSSLYGTPPGLLIDNLDKTPDEVGAPKTNDPNELVPVSASFRDIARELRDTAERVGDAKDPEVDAVARRLEALLAPSNEIEAYRLAELEQAAAAARYALAGEKAKEAEQNQDFTRVMAFGVNTPGTDPLNLRGALEFCNGARDELGNLPPPFVCFKVPENDGIGPDLPQMS